MPIPNAAHAIVAAEKVRDYLLNLDHPDGGSKAVWFGSLGYIRQDWHELATDLLAVARNCRDCVTVRTQFGIKFVARGWVGRPNHRSGRVLTVWIAEDDAQPRLVTAYPDEES